MALAQGISGNVSGVIAATGATFNFHIDNWVLESQRVIGDTSGFGDTDSTYTVGKKSQRGAASGWLKTDVAPGVDSVGAAAASITLTYSSGRTYVGKAIIFNIRVGPVSYKQAAVPISFQFVIDSGITATES